MATMDTDTHVRLKMPMKANTKVGDGGDCVEAADNKCSDDFGEQFTMPTDGTWKQFTPEVLRRGLQAGGLGQGVSVEPRRRHLIQFQSVEKPDSYDFYIDDLYFTK